MYITTQQPHSIFKGASGAQQMRWFTSGLLSSFGDYSLGVLCLLHGTAKKGFLGTWVIAKPRLVLQVKSCVFPSLALKMLVANYPTPTENWGAEVLFFSPRMQKNTRHLSSKIATIQTSVDSLSQHKTTSSSSLHLHQAGHIALHDSRSLILDARPISITTHQDHYLGPWTCPSPFGHR